jgi:prolipoprotein diacylglyceryltransferase
MYTAGEVAQNERRGLRAGRSAFRICGCTGVALAVLLAMTLVLSRGASPAVMLPIVVAAVATFLALTMMTKIVVGAEQLTYYHHEIAVLGVTALLLRLLHEPVLLYLDATILGVGLFLACGRIGCLMMGCCYGRPWRWGVRYHDGHVAAGFPYYLAGVRLFPTQVVESISVLSIVAIGSAIVLQGRPPGAALEWYVVAYGAVRFGMEFMRGDAARPYLFGFSEAQWTSVVLACGVVLLERARLSPFVPWHLYVAAGLMTSMIAVGLARRCRSTPTHALLHPRHLKEIAELVAHFSRQQISGHASAAGTISVALERTALGILLSASAAPERGSGMCHYAFSRADEPMTWSSAKVLATLILRLRAYAGPSRLIPGPRGVFHLFFPVLHVRPADDGQRWA